MYCSTGWESAKRNVFDGRVSLLESLPASFFGTVDVKEIEIGRDLAQAFLIEGMA